MPRPASYHINRVVERAILGCLNVAIDSIPAQSKAQPAPRAASVLAGLSGGISGFFGFAAHVPHEARE